MKPILLITILICVIKFGGCTGDTQVDNTIDSSSDQSNEHSYHPAHSSEASYEEFECKENEVFGKKKKCEEPKCNSNKSCGTHEEPKWGCYCNRTCARTSDGRCVPQENCTDADSSADQSNEHSYHPAHSPEVTYEEFECKENEEFGKKKKCEEPKCNSNKSCGTHEEPKWGCYCKETCARTSGGRCVPQENCTDADSSSDHSSYQSHSSEGSSEEIIVCPKPLCAIGCEWKRIDGNDCPQCVCPPTTTTTTITECPLYKCQANCSMELIDGNDCPQCVCPPTPTTETGCIEPLCAIGCERKLIDGCPQCVCSSTTTSDTTCPPLPECEKKGCELKRFADNDCPECVCTMECPENEEYKIMDPCNNCMGTCQPQDSPEWGCDCVTGYCRKTDILGAECIPTNECHAQ